jgi:hypothetical protein
MSQFDRAFSAEVLAHLEGLCQDFQATVTHKLADKIQEDHPELSHSQIVDAIGRFIRVDGDGSQDKAEHWFQFSVRDIASAFEDQFEDEDEDDDWDDDDNSDAYVAHYEQVEQEGMSENDRYFWRTIRWHDNGLEERVRFCRFDDYREGDPEDADTFFYGISPEVAVVGHGNDEWVIVGLS